MVKDTPEGVLLTAQPAFAPTEPKDVFGSLPHKGPANSIAEMDAGIAAEAKRRLAIDTNLIVRYLVGDDPGDCSGMQADR